MSEEVSKSEADKNRDDQRWRWIIDQVLRCVSLVLVLVTVMLFTSKLYTYPPEYVKAGEWAIALIAWKDFLLGAVVVAFIWLVRSLWE